MNKAPYRKLTIVGDGAVGKTCLFQTYANNAFPFQYVPTVCDGHVAKITVDGILCHAGFCDIPGREECSHMRHYGYPQTDIFMIAFSVDRPQSLANVRDKWIPEINQYCPNVPCLIVGCKSDLRWSAASGRRCIDVRHIMEFTNGLGLTYVETSALTQTGLKECFENAVRLTLGFHSKL